MICSKDVKQGRRSEEEEEEEEDHEEERKGALLGAAKALKVEVMRGPASPHLVTPLHSLTGVLRVTASAASLPHQRWDLRDRRCPGRLGRNRGEPELLPATGDLHTLVCGLVRRLRHARAGGGPHVPKDSSPHLVTPRRLTRG